MNTTVVALTDIGFTRGERTILSGINWYVQRQQIAAILGANGCGKSTLLRIICGYLWPQEGQVRLLGQTLGEVPLAALRARVGIVEATTIYPFDESMTAHEVVTSGYFAALTLGYITPSADQWAHAENTLAQVGLGHQARQLYATLSTGERMRCLLARALVRRPELLLLDEPTAGLDLPSREAVLATLARLHDQPDAPAIITVTHHLEELLPATTNVLLLSPQGTTIAQGTPAHTLTSANLTKTYGVPIQITHRQGRYSAHVDPQTWSELL
jgi:iron complex transport system ATP-binding protein